MGISSTISHFLLLYLSRHPRIRGSLVAGGGGDGQHAKSMVEATTHIFHSRSKAMSTSVGVLKAKSELSGPRVDLLHQNSTSM